MPTSDGASGVTWGPPGGSGSPAQGTGEWVYNNTTTEPPAANQIRFDNADPSLATQMWLRELSADSIDVSLWLALIADGDRIVVVDKDDATRYEVYEVSGTPTDDGLYWDLAVTNIATGANPLVSGQRVRVTVLFGGGGAAPGGSGESLIVSVNQVAHPFAVGDVVRVADAGTSYTKAQADSVANAEVAGIVTEDTDADNFMLTVGGLVEGLTGLTAGAVHWLDPDTAGELTATEPTTTGDVSKPILIALPSSTTSGLFFNMRGALIGNEDAETTLDLFNYLIAR